ncbi:hypothetical protein OEZ86_010895 [Tetradesmus obliquus]|nr:hypothetical protein OEZ86_010895 [Tetradesmus obliquus]
MPSHQNRQWSDEYMMYEYKVKQCLRTDHHNWKHCPWRHPGETAAQRRHPSVHKPTFCVNLKVAGECSAGDDCPFSHNTFEMSLHPLRYKTTLCNLGEKCNREICFFAHSHKDLRTPEPEAGDAAAAAAGVGGVALSGGSFSGATAAPGAAALGLVTNTGEVVQISNGSFTSGQQAMLLRQELTGYDSVTSQSSFSTGGGSFTRSVAPGAALLQQQQQLTPPMLDTAFDSFTSQCSTSSQLSGLGYRSMPLSPLMDRSQGSAVSQAQGFAAMAGQAGQGSQGSLPRVLAAPSPPGSVNAAAAGMLFTGNGQNAGNGNAMLPPSGLGGRRSLDAGPMLAPACAAPGGPTSSSLQQQQLAAKQQQEAAAAAVQQQVMQLQLRSAEWQQ